ncbi:MAG TPA: hypothetical protein VNC50_05795, partial [Planctomycetia bacterium]|nr:hypothetical protein [Planctomycetia bacterium]
KSSGSSGGFSNQSIESDSSARREFSGLQPRLFISLHERQSARRQGRKGLSVGSRFVDSLSSRT